MKLLVDKEAQVSGMKDSGREQAQLLALGNQLVKQ
jgi:hypothetical protein